MLKLAEFQKNFPEYSFGQILYSSLNLKYKGADFKKSDILDLTDRELYECLSKSFMLETDEKVEKEEFENWVNNLKEKRV